MPVTYTQSKRLNEALTRLERCGWRLARRNKHLVFVSPDSRHRLHIALTIPDKGHTINNYLSRIRRAIQLT